MSVSDMVVIVSLIAMDIYGFYVLRKAHKEIASVGVMKRQMMIDFHHVKKNLQKDITETTDGILLCVEELKMHVKEVIAPNTISDIGEATILKTLESIAMQNLPELGRKKAMVKNAKIGLQVAGNEIAKGMGVNEILERAKPMLDTAVKGQEMMDKYSDDPVMQMVIGFVKQKFSPDSPGGDPGSGGVTL